MRIALFMITPLTFGGGAEKYFIDLAKNLSKYNNSVDIITMNDSYFDKYTKLLSIYYARPYFIKKMPIKIRENKDKIIQKLNPSKWIRCDSLNLKKTLNQYDVIYVKNEIPDLILLKKNKYKELPPIIVGVHTPLVYPICKSFHSKLHNYLYQSFIYKYLLKGTKRIHVLNKFTQKLIENKFKSQTNLIYHPFSTQKIKIDSKKYPNKIVFNKQKKNIAFIARLTEQKGIDLLIKIINNLARKEKINKKIKINIFGSGDKQKKILELASKYKFIKYFGHVENKYIPYILSKQDLFISTANWESLPFNVLEAQAMGIPVLAFDIYGINDIVNTETGILVKNEAEFYNELLNFINNKYKFNKKNIIKNIDKNFNPKKINENMLNMFKNHGQ